MEPRLCRIESSLGRTSTCPREFCPLWHGGMCVVAGLRADLATTAGLPELLLGIRERLEDVSTDASLLPPGLR